MNRWNDTPRKLYLKPAELVLCDEPTMITTVLGSCVAVTLFSARLRIGAICHAVLPSGPAKVASKYVDQSVRYMTNYFLKNGITPDEIVAKLFGGAEMLAQTNPKGKDRTVGAQNIRMALESLRNAGLEPAAHHIGGRYARKLVFFSHSGEVFLKQVAGQDQEPKVKPRRAQ